MGARREADEMTKVTISVLGGLHFIGLDEAALTRKVKAVAAFLALQQGQPQSREKVAAMFWENSPEEQARTNLRQCLSSLRKHLKEALITKTDMIWLDPSQVDLDVTRFEALIGKQEPEASEEAITLYKGDLLDGFAIKEEAFESWLRSERERYRNLMIDGLTRLISSKEASGDHAAVATLTTRLLVLDQLNEAAHRTLMKAYAAQGRHDAALKQFEICKGTLERELGVGPQQETASLYSDLKVRRRTNSPSNLRSEVPVVNVASEFEAMDIDFSLPAKPSIILLPFKDLSAKCELGYLAEGIRIDVQSALVKISGLFIIAAGSAKAYVNRSVEPEQIAKEMGVQYVLNASLQGDTNKIRLTAQLTDGLDGHVVWSEHYDRALGDQFLLQDELTEKIVTSLDVALASGEQARVWRKTLRNPKALELYYRGLELLTNFDKPSVAAARQLFERVSEISPDVTLGPTLVAFCHYWDATMGWAIDADSALEDAANWSQKAAAMDDADGQAHVILAHVKLLRGEHKEALEIAEEAIKLRPLCANTNALFGNILLYCGRPKEAVDHVKTAIRSAPVYALWWVEILASAYRDGGQNNQAITAINELLSKKPDSTSGLTILISALVADGQLETAKGYAVKLMKLDPEFSISQYATRHPYRDRRQIEPQLANLKAAGLRQ